LRLPSVAAQGPRRYGTRPGGRLHHAGPDARYAAPIRAISVKRAWEIYPVALRIAAGLGLTVLRDLPRRCLGHVAAREGSSWSARSRAAARTNEL